MANLLENYEKDQSLQHLSNTLKIEAQNLDRLVPDNQQLAKQCAQRAELAIKQFLQSDTPTVITAYRTDIPLSATEH